MYRVLPAAALLLLFALAGGWGASAQSLKVQTQKSVFLKEVKPSAGGPGISYDLFPNIGKIAYYENLKAYRALMMYERKKERDYAELDRMLTAYVTSFGVKNFSQVRDLDLVWKLAQVKEIQGDTTMAKFYYRLAINNQCRFYNEIQLHYDQLEERYHNKWVDIDYFYKVLAAYEKVDTLEPPKGMLLKLGKEVNTRFPDYAPFMHPNQKIMLFSSRRSEAALIDNFEEERNEDIFFTMYSKGDNKWSKARMFESSINTVWNEGSACINLTADTLYFVRCNHPEGYGQCDIYRAEWIAGDWGNVTNLGPNVNTEYWDSHPNLSPDGRYLYFTSNRKDGFGRTDIYRSTRQLDGSWGKAENLGPIINTIEDEVTPFMHPIFNTLYFSSTGHMHNQGGFDIFKTRWLGDHWETPRNLGPLVNTPRDEYYFSVDYNGEVLYHSKAQPENPKNFDLYSFPMPMAARPDAIAMLKGYLLDAETGHPLTGIIQARDLKEDVVIEPIYINKYGYFEFRLINNREYELLVIGNDAIHVSGQQEANKDSVFKGISDGALKDKPVIFDAIAFNPSSTELTPATRSRLDDIILFLKAFPTCTLNVSGHTDNSGDEAANDTLSQARADAIKQYLVEMGRVDSAQILAKGFGQRMPVYPNDNQAHKAANRRVEFEFKIPEYERKKAEQLKKEGAAMLLTTNMDDLDVEYLRDSLIYQEAMALMEESGINEDLELGEMSALLEVDGFDLKDVLTQQAEQPAAPPKEMYESGENPDLGLFEMQAGNTWLEKALPDEEEEELTGELDADPETVADEETDQMMQDEEPSTAEDMFPELFSGGKSQ